MGEMRDITDKFGIVHHVEICNPSEMTSEERALTETFQDNVDLAVFLSKFRGNPIARYDFKRNASYWEYPDGRREYDLKPKT